MAYLKRLLRTDCTIDVERVASAFPSPTDPEDATIVYMAECEGNGAEVYVDLPYPDFANQMAVAQTEARRNRTP